MHLLDAHAAIREAARKVANDTGAIGPLELERNHPPSGRRRVRRGLRDDDAEARGFQPLERGHQRIGFRGGDFEMHHAGKLAGDVGHAAAGPIRAESLRALGQLADDARAVGSDRGDDERCDLRLALVGQRHRPANERRLGRETRVLRKRGKLALLRRMANHAGQQRKAHRRERTLPQLARGLAFGDEAPVLRGNGPRVPAIGEVIHRPSRDRIPLHDRPLDRGDPAMPRQQRRMVADAAEAGPRERLVADPRMRVRCDDEIGAVGDRLARHDLRVLQHVQRHASGLRRLREPVVHRRHHDLRDVDAVPAQRLERRRPEISGSHQSDLHRTSRASERAPRCSWRRAVRSGLYGSGPLDFLRCGKQGARGVASIARIASSPRDLCFRDAERVGDGRTEGQIRTATAWDRPRPAGSFRRRRSESARRCARRAGGCGARAAHASSTRRRRGESSARPAWVPESSGRG